MYTKQYNALLLAVRAGDNVDVQKMLELQETSKDLPFEKSIAFATLWFKLPEDSMMHIEAWHENRLECASVYGACKMMCC